MAPACAPFVILLKTAARVIAVLSGAYIITIREDNGAGRLQGIHEYFNELEESLGLNSDPEHLDFIVK